MRTTRAYSLIEITVVFVIMSILTGIGWSLMRNTTTSTIDSSALQILQTTATAIDDAHTSRGVWYSDPESLGRLVAGPTFTSGPASVTSVSAAAAADGVYLATVSPAGDCLTLTVTSAGWADGSFRPNDTRSCQASEVTE